MITAFIDNINFDKDNKKLEGGNKKKKLKDLLNIFSKKDKKEVQEKVNEVLIFLFYYYLN